MMINSTENRYQALQQILVAYITATKEMDSDKLCSLLHPDARIYNSDSMDSRKLQLHWQEIPPHMKNLDKDQYRNKTKMNITSITIDGTIAHTVISVQTYFNYEYLDMHAFLWAKNQWQMISKVSHLIKIPGETTEKPSGKEIEEIIHFMNSYIATCFQLDFKQMRNLAHPEARMFISGQVHSENLHDHWIEDEQKFQGKDPDKWASNKNIFLQGVDVRDGIALVKLQFAEKWLDLHQLLKIGKKWYILNKLSQPI